MQPGDLLRQRKIRTYGQADCRNYFEFSPDQERRKEFQKVFVSLLLGVEHMKLNDKPGGPLTIEPLDELRVLNGLGFWSEEQLVAVLGNKGALALLKKLRPFVGKQREKK